MSRRKAEKRPSGLWRESVTRAILPVGFPSRSDRFPKAQSPHPPAGDPSPPRPQAVRVGLAKSIRREETFSRRDFFAAGLAIAGGVSAACRPAEQANVSLDQALAKAARYLWARQSEDDGWHSASYGLLRSGQSLTPFVLDALARVPTDVVIRPAEKLARAIEFVRLHTDAAGAVGRMDPLLPDYPTYSTTLAVKALCLARPSGWEQDVTAMVTYLRGQQFTEANGWRRDDAAYGAWGMGGDRRRPPSPGHVDLSMTRHALEALSAAGVSAGDPAFHKATVYVERCHNFDPSGPDARDGGFYFSTVVLDANKAGPDGDGHRSYGTATADGILALLAVGRSPEDERVRGARRWLESHHLPDRATGFVGEAYRRWPGGLRFYYAACATKALRQLGAVPRKESSPGVAPSGSVSQALQAEQRPDGSWSNPEDLVKEDDPLIATPFAVRALVNERDVFTIGGRGGHAT